MDASNEAPFGVSLDEFIEFTKRARGGFVFFHRTEIVSHKQRWGDGERLRNCGLIFSLAESVQSEVASILCFRTKSQQNSPFGKTNELITLL